MRDDVGGEIGGIGRGEVSFAQKGEVDDVVEEVSDGAGGEEGEGKEIVTREREDVESDGGVAL